MYKKLAFIMAYFTFFINLVIYTGSVYEHDFITALNSFTYLILMIIIIICSHKFFKGIENDDIY